MDLNRETLTQPDAVIQKANVRIVRQRAFDQRDTGGPCLLAGIGIAVFGCGYLDADEAGDAGQLHRGRRQFLPAPGERCMVSWSMFPRSSRGRWRDGRKGRPNPSRHRFHLPRLGGLLFLAESGQIDDGLEGGGKFAALDR